MCKLVLNVGDTVRNIRERSSFKGWVGKVLRSSSSEHYRVEYQNGHVADYQKVRAHESLEKLVSWNTYSQQMCGIDLSALELRILADPDIWKKLAESSGSDLKVYYEAKNAIKHRTLKKVRRNVLTGKTQEEHVKQLGYSRGVQEFNTRALGRSTGQALHAIGSAMMNPGTEIRISNIDHARENPMCSTSWTTLNKHFRQLTQSLIGDMKGFTFTDTHIVFNPIVTEETYVEL